MQDDVSNPSGIVTQSALDLTQQGPGGPNEMTETMSISPLGNYIPRGLAEGQLYPPGQRSTQDGQEDDSPEESTGRY